MISQLIEAFLKIKESIKTFRDLLLLSLTLMMFSTTGITVYLFWWITDADNMQRFADIINRDRPRPVVGVLPDSESEKLLLSVQRQLHSDNIAVVSYDYFNRVQVLNWASVDKLYLDRLPIDTIPEQVAAHWQGYCYFYSGLQREWDGRIHDYGISAPIFGQSLLYANPSAFVIVLSENEMPASHCKVLQAAGFALRQQF